MRELFNVAELVRIGVEDEASGVAYYFRMADKTANPELKKMFTGLADQERYHKKRFEDMLESLGGYKQKEQYPGEYMEYLRTLTEGRAFPDPAAAVLRANECKDDAQAIDLASRFERDTLILMNEMKGLLPQADADIVNEMVREEQSHLVVLGEAKKIAERRA